LCNYVGPAINDPRLTAALANYWQHDALLQLLLHAVRLLLLHRPAASSDQQQQRQQQGPDGAADAADGSASKEKAQRMATYEQQQQQQQRAAGLPELLEAVQQLSKVRCAKWRQLSWF
jgi:hypothetical protein